MLLDASSFATVLTPESVLSMLQKQLAKMGWKKYEVQEIRLIYTPFYVFSFDVTAEGAGQVGGKAALNAYTGELNEFVNILLEKPLKKTKNSEEGGEIEETSISTSEVKEAAQAKIAAQAGLKREIVSISAVSKLYVPFYRVWVEVADDVYKMEVDACLGSASGMEQLPVKEKGWSEVANETVNKMKSPSGWAELGGKTIGAVGGAASGKIPGGKAGGILGGKETRWILLAVVVIVLVYLFFATKQGGVKCDGTISGFGRNQCILLGTCTFTNPSKDAQQMLVRVNIITKDGKRNIGEGVSINQQVSSGTTGDAWKKGYNVTWSANMACSLYDWTSEQIK